VIPKNIEFVDITNTVLYDMITKRLQQSVEPHDGYGMPSEKIILIESEVVRIPKITIEEEVYGSVCSASDRRAYVLVKCDYQTKRLRNKLRNVPNKAEILHDEEEILHPARVRCYLEVQYTVCDPKFSHKDYIEKPREEVAAASKKAHFAIVDYYKVHSMRKTWAWSNAAEIWSDVLDPFYGFVSHQLVSVHSLAGKFVPGRFTEKFPLLKNQWKTGMNHKDSKPMAVLRLPLRNCF